MLSAKWQSSFPRGREGWREEEGLSMPSKFLDNLPPARPGKVYVMMASSHLPPRPRLKSDAEAQGTSRGNFYAGAVVFLTMVTIKVCAKPGLVTAADGKIPANNVFFKFSRAIF